MFALWDVKDPFDQFPSHVNNPNRDEVMPFFIVPRFGQILHINMSTIYTTKEKQNNPDSVSYMHNKKYTHWLKSSILLFWEMFYTRLFCVRAWIIGVWGRWACGWLWLGTFGLDVGGGSRIAFYRGSDTTRCHVVCLHQPCEEKEHSVPKTSPNTLNQPWTNAASPARCKQWNFFALPKENLAERGQRSEPTQVDLVARRESKITLVPTPATRIPCCADVAVVGKNTPSKMNGSCLTQLFIPFGDLR